MDYIFYNIQKTFPSDRNTVNLVEPILLEIKLKLNIPEDKFFVLMIAVTEGINNAVHHGNKLDPSKSVYFSLTVKAQGSTPSQQPEDCPKVMNIKIGDEGGGFNPERVEDPRTPENLLKESGRGIFIIKSLMSSVDYLFTEKGTELTFDFIL